MCIRNQIVLMTTVGNLYTFRMGKQKFENPESHNTRWILVAILVFYVTYQVMKSLSSLLYEETYQHQSFAAYAILIIGELYGNDLVA